MNDPAKRRGFLYRIVAGLAVPMVGIAATADRTRTSPKRSAGAVDFAVWNQVNDVVHAYADCIDRFDLDGLVEVFLPDGTYDYRPDMVLQGREAIKAAGIRMLSNYSGTWHNMSSPTVVSGKVPGTFDSMTYFVARHAHKDGGFHALYGRYVDSFAHDPSSARLLIATRKVIAHMAEGEVGERYWLPRQS